MNTMWKLFTGDIKRLTSNVVSIIIVIGLVMIPGLFTWFNEEPEIRGGECG